jgi:hypothetical protein
MRPLLALLLAPALAALALLPATASAASIIGAPAAAPAPINRLPQGGGVIYPAWTAEFWANPDHSGAPAYTRSDVRVSHDWETFRPIIGVQAESVRDFPRERFSARWTGRLLPRFAEDYTLKLVSSSRARVRLKAPGEAAFRTVIDAWAPHTRRTNEATLRLDPSQTYDIVIDYAHEGPAGADLVCELRWSSPGTPEEVIDYVSGNSVHFMYQHVLANVASFSGASENSATQGGIKVDELGWPVADFTQTMLQGFTHHAGRMLITFLGQAEISGPGTFVVGGETFTGTLPKGKGYDAATNRTRVFVDLTPESDGETSRTRYSFGKTQRTASSPVGSGLTELEVLLAREVNGKVPHEPGEIIHQPARTAFLPIYTFRVQRTGLNEIEKWSERTLPGYSRIMGQKWRADMAYEKLVLAANELGRDLHLCYSDSADEEFMRKLALLAKYGSDGVEPYTRPTANPVWPPLNPNLRFYLEHGNEMGWSGIQPRTWSRTYEQQIHGKADHPVWKVVNFDGRVTEDRQGGLMRYHAYRTVLMSEAMRSVWGDAAMGDRIRVMLFGQYERWFQNGMLQFIHDYYSNPAHVATPRPVSRILWAAGPAVYYGTTNNFAVGATPVLANHDFEATPLAPGEARLAPAGVPGWKFEGGAGLIDHRLPRHLALAKTTAGAAEKIAGRAAVGYRITVGDRDLYLIQAARHVQAGEKGTANTSVFDLEGKALYPSKHPAMRLAGAKPGELVFTSLDHCGWATSDSSRVGAWRLVAGQSYLVVSEVADATIPGADTALEPGPGFTIDGPVMVKRGGIATQGITGGKPEFTPAPGRGYPLPSFRYSFADTSLPGYVLMPSDPFVDTSWTEGGRGKSFIPESHRAGTTWAFLAGKAKLTQTFRVEKAGEYALVFTANSSLNKWQDRNGENPFTIRIGDEVVWDNTVGESRKPKGGVFQWGTRYLRLEPGAHTLTIESRSADPKDVVYLHAMHLGSIEDFAGGPEAKNFLGAGAATGQTDGRFAMIAELCTAMAQNWGLVPYAYEGGTSSGGDWNGGKFEFAHQFKWEHPWSKAADNQWARYWHDFGGANAFYYYPGFEYKYIHRAHTYMPWAASIDRAHTWVHEPRGPVAAPVTFTPAMKHYQSEPAAQWENWFHPFVSERQYAAVTAALPKPGVWKGFVFRAPSPGRYEIVARTKGDGTARLHVNDSQAVVRGPAGAELRLTVFLPQAIHAVRLENLGGEFELESITIAPAATRPLAAAAARSGTAEPFRSDPAVEPSTVSFGRLRRY